jgi:two-component system KDP operon response regulator KdpE
VQAIIVSNIADEISVLKFALQQDGLPVRSIISDDFEPEKLVDSPPDLLLVAWEGESPPLLALIQRVRRYTLTPLALICDPLPEQTQIALYRSGVDQIVTRPFSTRLFMVQIQVMLRRAGHYDMHELPDLQRGVLSLIPSSHQARLTDHEPIHLTNLEFRLLHTLMIHSGHVLSNEYLVNTVWGYAGEGNRELVRGLVQRLRAKIEPDPHNPQFILTEPGVGYRFVG